MDETLQQARKWVSEGIAVIPLPYGKKEASIRWGLFQKELPSEKLVTIWFGGAARNLGIITGWQGLTVIDFDNFDVYHAWRGLYPELTTYEIITARGVHTYFFENHPSKNASVPGVLDIKAAGGYVLAPPSLHPSGWVYQVLTEAPILRIDSVLDVLPTGLFTPPVRDELITRDNLPDLPPTPLADAWQRANNPRPYKSPVEAAKSIPILDILPGPVTQSSQDGRWFVSLCPFHDDHNPSFWIDTARGLCGCHTCRMKQMDVVNLYARLRGIDNSQAITALATRGGVH